LIFAALAFITGLSIYGLIYAPRLFKAGAILLLGTTVYILYALVKQWTASSGKSGNFSEAEIIEEETN